MEQFLQQIAGADAVYGNVFIAILRWVMPALTAILLLRCARPLVGFRREPEIWAWLCLGKKKKLPITHWENVIGRSKNSDIVIDFPTISKTHGVLTRYDDGSWTIFDAESKDGILVNGKKVGIKELHEEDVITIGGIDMTLQPISQKQEKKLAELRSKPAVLLYGIFAQRLRGICPGHFIGIWRYCYLPMGAVAVLFDFAQNRL